MIFELAAHFSCSAFRASVAAVKSECKPTPAYRVVYKMCKHLWKRVRDAVVAASTDGLNSSVQRCAAHRTNESFHNSEQGCAKWGYSEILISSRTCRLTCDSSRTRVSGLQGRFYESLNIIIINACCTLLEFHSKRAKLISCKLDNYWINY